MNTRGLAQSLRDRSRQLQFKGPHGDRSRGQAGPGGAGQPGDFSVQFGTHAEPGEPVEPDRSFSLQSDAATDSPSNAYFVLSGTSMAAPMVSATAALMLRAGPDAHAGPDQGAVDEDRVQGPVAVQLCHRSGHRPGVLSGGRHFHRRGGVPGYRGGAGEQRPHAARHGRRNVSVCGCGWERQRGVIREWRQRDVGHERHVGNQCDVGDTHARSSSATWGTSAMWGTRTLGNSAMWGTSFLAGDDVLWGTDPVATGRGRHRRGTIVSRRTGR